MEQVLKRFAEEYDLKVDRRIYNGDAQRSANNPILFVFIGDSVKAAYEHISSSIKEKWDNGGGIAFINIITDNIDDKDNCFNFQFSCDFKDNKKLRRNIKEKFYSDKKNLENFNKKITMARDKILSSGNLFNSFENINISVITTSDDPLNIIIPEITILIRKKMLEVFKTGSADLYILIKEKNVEDEFFSKAVSVSFFREIEYIQKDSFKFNEKIAVYGQDRELPATWTGPVFYMIYVLEEKNERGIIPAASMDNNYEIIYYINLIKNRNISGEAYSDTENQYYDNSRFKANITRENSINRYITAGLSKVKRPNGAIAVTVLKSFYERVIRKLNEFSIKEKQSIVEVLKIDEKSVASKLESMLCEGISIMDMNGIMMCNASAVEKRLSKLTLRQVEESLYGDRCQSFFVENFIKVSENNLPNMNIEKELRGLVRECILNNPKLGLYCAFKWTSEEGDAVKYLREKIKSMTMLIDNINNEIHDIYESRFVESFSLKNLFSKNKSIQEVRKKIFADIYDRKLQVLKLHLSKKIIQQYEFILLEIHEEVSFEIEQLNHIEKTINTYEHEIIKHQNEYTAQNVKIYYTNVVNDIVDKLEREYGEAFYLQDKYIGSLSENIENGKEKVLERITLFCSKHILTQEEFNKSFEEELKERANVNLSDWDGKVLSKEELYRKLYNILDSNSALKSYLMNYDVKGYQEKYFFGDYSSSFIKYAFDFDRKTRSYKIGYIHEIRSSGIEKLNLMGGFGAKDIIYIRTAIEFYNYCLENGYSLHGIDVELLPEIS
ncbi:hypothetical protein [Clostridium sp. DJ247]|uniref:hypothetical protein n=1 Tax=Clostridium sp. DJ247 TaxID=2726188 RepID=UPI001624550C|nr:hypothetical protein [Clostridium sp. DJ247]MBC2580430.1 hypothetical protein [Clostridium sp. DJ247]